MDTNPTPDAPLRDVAQNSDASARYLAEVQRVARDLRQGLETLAAETRVYCRGTHVEGDRKHHAWLRSRPVEKSLQATLKDLDRLAKHLEGSAFARRAHDDQVRALPAARREKELAKARKKGVPVLQAVPEVKQQPVEQPTTKIPTSIEDLRREWSA